MLRLKLLFLLGLMTVGVANINTLHAAETTNQANNEQEKFVSEVGESIRSLIADKNLPQDQLESGFRSILKKNFNLHSIGKFVLAKYWRIATEEEKTEFLKLFEDSIVKTYAAQFKDYSGEQFKVIGSKEGSDGGTVVLSQVLRQKPVDVNWFVREKNGQFQVNDVIVEGVSMSVTQRSEYGAIISKCGNGVQGLIQKLRENLAKQ